MKDSLGPILQKVPKELHEGVIHDYLVQGLTFALLSHLPESVAVRCVLGFIVTFMQEVQPTPGQAEAVNGAIEGLVGNILHRQEGGRLASPQFAQIMDAMKHMDFQWSDLLDESKMTRVIAAASAVRHGPG